MKRFISILVLCLIYNNSYGLPQHESKSLSSSDHDMWMEPADEMPKTEYSVVRSESRVVRRHFSSSSPEQESVSRVENFEPEVVISSSSSDPQVQGAEQKFLPAFYNGIPIATTHSRPYKIASTLAATIAGRYNSASRANYFDHSILGTGDFAVLRGGTFYPDEENRYQAKSDEFFEPFYTSSNGHGKPVAEALTAKKEQYFPEDPFENFKDFADMNTGSDPAFSHHYVVIYENKNSTKPHPSHPSPKNIFEQLQLLDLEKENNNKNSHDYDDEKSEKNVDKKLMKLSKYKTKLSKTKVVKKYKKKMGPKVEKSSSQDYIDPLLATS